MVISVDKASKVVHSCYCVLYSGLKKEIIVYVDCKFIILYFRPMYVDSTNNDVPAGIQTVYS